MSEEIQPESSPAEMPKPSRPRRRGRRGGRGRRRPAPPPPGSDVPAPAPGEEPVVQQETPKPSGPLPAGEGSAIQKAVDEVANIVDTLNQTLAQMEEVLELVELADRQKLADEKEIESLRRALRQIQSRRPGS